MGQLQERYKNYQDPQKYMDTDVCPYFREMTSKQGTEVEIGGHRVSMFGSNIYTRLTDDERIINAVKVALDKYGSGCAGSRFLNGTPGLHVQLEKELATFVGKDETLCFPMGFSVNQGALAMVVGRDDCTFRDDRGRANIVDGRCLSFVTQLRYKHNDMVDLEWSLQELPYGTVKLIMVDGMFSMEGGLANLPTIVKLKHRCNRPIMIDKARGLGVFGRQGRGVYGHSGLTYRVDLITGASSKSLTSIGGFIASDGSAINYLCHTYCIYVFSASDTPIAAVAAREALCIIQAEPERIEHLWKITHHVLEHFKEEGSEIGETGGPIVLLCVRDIDKAFMVAKLVFSSGAFINPVMPPARVSQGTLVRLALMATYTGEQVERGVRVLKKVFVDQGIIKKQHFYT